MKEDIWVIPLDGRQVKVHCLYNAHVSYRFHDTLVYSVLFFLAPLRPSSEWVEVHVRSVLTLVRVVLRPVSGTGVVGLTAKTLPVLNSKPLLA